MQMASSACIHNPNQAGQWPSHHAHEQRHLVSTTTTASHQQDYHRDHATSLEDVPGEIDMYPVTGGMK